VHHGEPEPARPPEPAREPAREPKHEPKHEPKREPKHEPKREPARRSRASFGASINPEDAKEEQPPPGPVSRKTAGAPDATPAYNTSSFGAGLLSDDLLDDDEADEADEAIDEIE